jgi:hypothetical protein
MYAGAANPQPLQEHMGAPTAIYVSAYYYICVLIQLCLCAHTCIQVVCKPSFSAEPILTEEDKTKAMATIERESENAHKVLSLLALRVQKYKY